MNSDFFKANRNRLKQTLDDGEVVVVTAYDKMQQTKDGFAPFRQEANFWWLTGINYPKWQVVYDSRRDEECLVRPTLSRTETIFESWLSDEEVVAVSGIATVISEREFAQRRKEWGAIGQTALSVAAPRYRDIHCHPNPSLSRLQHQLKRSGLAVDDISGRLAKLRAIKSPAEIACIRQAIAITNDSFRQVRPQLNDLTHESQVEAEFSYRFTRQGADHAYDPIVAFGKRACTLHYTHNNQPLGDGLLLLDIGATQNGYNADITRTYARGQATPFEQQLHTAVQAAQADIIASLRPGLAVKDYQAFVDQRMKTALCQLDLIDGPDDRRYRQYFPHAVSHGLGVDVHDSLGGAVVFEPGMVLTVEPGIYVPEQAAGVRIEDDILITDSGYDNLSADLPTTL